MTCVRIGERPFWVDKRLSDSEITQKPTIGGFRPEGDAQHKRKTAPEGAVIIFIFNGY